MEPDHPGMHKTASVDYEFVVSGSVVLELDDGREVELHPGDTVIHNGTRHAWRNKAQSRARWWWSSSALLTAKSLKPLKKANESNDS